MNQHNAGGFFFKLTMCGGFFFGIYYLIVPCFAPCPLRSRQWASATTLLQSSQVPFYNELPPLPSYNLAKQLGSSFSYRGEEKKRYAPFLLESFCSFPMGLFRLGLCSLVSSAFFSAMNRLKGVGTNSQPKKWFGACSLMWSLGCYATSHMISVWERQNLSVSRSGMRTIKSKNI
jgi:hypothetical protein